SPRPGSPCGVRPAPASGPERLPVNSGYATRGQRAREHVADGGGYGGGVLVERGVPGLCEPELRVRQRAGELAALLRWPGAVVAAVDHDHGLADAGQRAGQVEVALAGEDVVGRLRADRRPAEELG